MMARLRALGAEGRRRIVQVLAAVLYNANIGGFFKGTIYRGNSKKFCVPGLNCYSCPGAIASCPLGALQASLNNFPTAVPLYLLGILLLFGALLGRAVCAFLCPFGLIQELLYKIPTKKLKKSAWTRRLTVIKYIVLVVMVIALPLYFLIVNGVVTPAFCKWLCPAGTLEGGVPLVIANESLRAQLGWLFSWKALVTAAVIVASIFIYRPFCRFLCPLGAIYSLFNRTAVFGVRLDKKKCTHCGACARACKMDVRIVNDRECLRCGECVSRCPTGAISCKFIAPKGGKTHEETVRTGAHAGASHIRGAGDATQPGHRGGGSL